MSSHYSSQHHPSHIGECDALLQFSNSFIIARDASMSHCGTSNSYPKTASWKKNGTNCCSWDGVTCHMATNYVIGLDLSCSWLRGALDSNSTLFSLPNLQGLNLAGNDFLGSEISPRFGTFSGMEHLSLSSSRFSGPVPVEISHLSKLNALDLSGSVYPYKSNLTIEDDHSFKRLTSNLTQLRVLALDGVDMSRISPTSLTNLSSTLTSLSLRACNLQGIFPIDIFHLPNLRNLSLSNNNYLMGTLPQTNWTGQLISLEVSSTKFHGSIPALLGNLTSLNFLSLSLSEFTGPIPPTLGNLDRLTHLDLGGINHSGTVDFEMFEPLKNLQLLWLSRNLSVLLQNKGNCSFPSLKVLALTGCNLTEFPYFLSSSKNLVVLYLFENMIRGRIPEWFWRVRWDALTELDLSSNNLSGEIQSSICQVSSLRFLQLSNNRFDGTIPACLGNLSSLFQLALGNNLLQGPLPQSLANCTFLLDLNVSFNRMYDTFPHWLTTTMYSLNYLDLQSNKFHGVIEIPLPQLSYLSLSDNDFEGPLPTPPPTINYYFTSNNNFSGDIPHQLCNATGLEIINLSNNSLTGSIPHCFINLTASLSVLDLRANQLVGQIPEIFVPGNNLTTIHLSQNQLGGTLMRSLAHCTNLEVLDLSENELKGPFPYWLETLPNLQVLVLRSNKFHGAVDNAKGISPPFPNLRILDLSGNSFSGQLPAEYIAKLKAMKNDEISGSQYMEKKHGYYQDSIAVVMKGFEIELVKILNVFTTIDFSRNFFEGEIPEIIGDLKALKGLNFSHNNLTNNIPSSVGSLTNLEWLDLSSNKLNGEIPRDLADLSSLSYLNLSNNQLVGQIPRSTQFDTFDHSFDGNPNLCGHPLPKACGTDTQQSPPLTPPGKGDEEAKSGRWIEWRAVPMGYGCGLALGISAWYIMQETMRPRWLARMVERKIYRMTNRKKKKQKAAPRSHAVLIS
ncbi:receptor-like protein 6 [Punica granatum]|uniref:Receptor-like protein 6 n=1 Tax=Punica granatum TaxID=22663 RepID=A0A218W4X7_PUNGR|nr:receptor-like protein 6 [Punica granatum]OWM67593.1 hypothetical protein CDL15_Pgr024678 [Punica granatum]